MGLILPHVVGQHQRFAATWEAANTPGTYVPPTASDFIKVLSSDFAIKQEQSERDDTNEGEDYYEMITERAERTWSIERYFTPAAAGVEPPEGRFWQHLLGAAPTIVASTSVTYGLLNGAPATNRHRYRSLASSTRAKSSSRSRSQAV